MLTGSARVSQIEQEKTMKLERQQEIERNREELEKKRVKMESNIRELKHNLNLKRMNLERIICPRRIKGRNIENQRNIMAKVRHSADEKIGVTMSGSKLDLKRIM